MQKSIIIVALFVYFNPLFAQEQHLQELTVGLPKSRKHS
jgi:hypothetical protein